MEKVAIEETVDEVRLENEAAMAADFAEFDEQDAQEEECRCCCCTGECRDAYYEDQV